MLNKKENKNSKSVRKNRLKSEKVDKILELFYENPNRKFTVREIEKLTKIPRATIHDYLKILKRQNLITQDNKAIENLVFKTKKINYFVERIVNSGLIKELIKKLNPSCVILFGGIRKGDSVKESDIDIFIESHFKKQIDIKKYEKKLKHKIQLFIETDINNLQPNLFNNVVNGIKLFGSFKIK